MIKTLVSLAFALFLVLFYFEEKNGILPTFQMTESPTIISKGQYGHSLIVELSYSHEGLSQWIAQLPTQAPLFLVDHEWLLRSPEIVDQLIEQKIVVGLLGSASKDYEDTALLERQLSLFKKTFNQLPLWFATTDYIIEPSMQSYLHDLGINSIAPSTTFTTPNMSLTEGEFISIPLHREQNISFEQINEFIRQHKLLSIEENIFGYQISTKRLP